MRPNSNYSIGSLRIVAVALFALVISSCQTEPAKPVENGTYAVSIPTINEEYREPDLVTWRIGSDTGSAVVAGGGSSFQLQLQSKVEGEVRFDLWRSGIRIMRLKYVRKTETTLEYVSKEFEDTLARDVFQQILPSKDSIAFAKKLAELVVGRDSVDRAVEQAAAKVVGVNHDTLMARALQIMVESGKAIGVFLPQEGGTFLGHSLESIHVQVKVLVELKVIVTDTNALFPPPPLRVVSNLSMPERLQAGGDAAGVNGKFVATGKIATLIAKVYQDTIDVSRHFEIPQVDLTSRPKELELNGTLWVTAKSTAAAGTYRLEVVVMDADETPNSIKAVVGFQVIPAADSIGPSIQILSPSTGTVLENDVSTVEVKAQVEDPSGLDSVWIGDKLAVGKDGIWSLAAVEIPVTDIGFAVVVRAKDSKGNSSSKDVLVGRKAKLDPGAPSWSVLSPKANELFPFDSVATTVSWKVADPRADIVKAWIGGGEASKESDGIWIRRVDLPATGSLTTIALLAVNANNDTIKGFVQVTREADTKGPVIQIKSPVDGTVFAYDAQSVLVKVATADPSGVDSVKIDGKPAESVGTEYAYSMALEAGKEVVIRVQAWDKLKNRSFDSIKVTRKGPPDTTAPRLRLLGPASGTELSMDTKTAILRWLVTDLFGLVDADVTIDGKVAKRSADTFSLEVAAPAPGKEESHRIDVKNIKGVANFETMTLKRAKDVVAPKLIRVDSGRTVPFETEKATVSWKVTDNYLLGSVTIAGKVVTAVDGLYSQEVALATGDNRVAIVATDSANNSSTDTVIVHRTWKDTSKPLVVRQSGTEPKNVPFATAEFTASWKVTDNALSTVTINGVVITGTDGIYSLKVTLAQAQTPIKIVAKDAANNSKMDSITITKSDDLVDPVVARLPGTKDTTVPYATSTYALGWEVIDENGVASVSVNGALATKSGDNYRLAVSLSKVGLNEFLMVAKDVAGNDAWDTIRIHRAYHDSVAPQRVRGVNTKDTTVPYGTAKYTLSWTVTDNDLVKSVTIGGGVASVSQNVYSRELSLAAGSNKFGMLATDTAGNTATDTVVITVATDGGAPVIVRETGTKDSTVAYGVTSITLKWKITDDVGVASVKVNGTALQSTSGIYAFPVPDLAIGANGFKIVAVDITGKTSFDSVTITRSALVNTAPSFSKGLDVTISEDEGAQIRDGWATGMSAGTQSEEKSQKLTFQITTSNDALFAIKPQIDLATGDLSFTPAMNANGSATLTIVLKDDGGVANGGVDASAPQTALIKINAINDAPSFVVPAAKSINEDAGAQEEKDFLSSISKGPANEAAQTLTWTVTSTNPGLFTDVPALSGTSLKYKTAPNANGSSTITIRLKDNGGIDGGGADEMVKTWVLTVLPVNDAPSFTKGSDLGVKNYDGTRSIAGWIKSMAPGGGADESIQALSFKVSSDNSAIFATQPSIDESGTLTFAPAVNQFGVATVTVALQDNGGIANGGTNTSMAQTFKIEVQDTVMDEMGNSYPFKKLGTQTWMLQNMRNKAGSVPVNGKQAMTEADLKGAAFTYAGGLGLPDACNTTNCSNLIATQHKGVCPEGWHVPTYAEWTTLMLFAGGTPDDPGVIASGKLGATWGHYSCSRSISSTVETCTYDNDSYTDEYGFGLPANLERGGGGPAGSWWHSYSGMWLPAEDPEGNPRMGAMFEYAEVTENKTKGGIRCMKN